MSAQETADLPEYLTPKERHQRHRDEGMHPSIDPDDEYWDVLSDDNDYFVVQDGDRLIGMMERGTDCPVCGEPDSVYPKYGTYSDGELSDSSFTFIRGVNGRDNPIQDRLESSGYYPLVCKAVNGDYLVGIASSSAIKEYDEWKQSEKKRRKFHKRVKRIREKRELDRIIGHGYGYGELLAAVYEEMGAQDYDEHELMGRSSITKGQLVAILARLRSLEFQECRDMSENDWLWMQETCVGLGDVEWHIPEWVDFDGLTYSDRVKTRVFE